MNRLSFFAVLLAGVLIGGSALAQEEGVAMSTDDLGSGGGYSVMVVGGQISMGMAHMIGDDDDAKPRFAGGGLVYFDYYLSEMLALEAGLGLVGKGARAEGTIMGTDYELKAKGLYMEIPLGVKLNIQNFRIGAFIAMYIGLTGKTDSDPGGEADWEWDDYRRFNLGPKISLGYAIPVGPIFLVPGLDWSIHLLNENTGDNSDDYAIRSMNLMFNVGVEYGL